MVGSVRVCAEEGGWLDYSDYAKTAFIKAMKAKYDSIGKLNQRWGRDYADFDAIEPPADAQENVAAWLEFKDFCAQRYARVIRKTLTRFSKLTCPESTASARAAICSCWHRNS